MSQKISLLALTIKASAALSAHTFATATGAVAAAAGDAHGVTLADAAIGDLVAVDVLGTTIVKVAADVAAGDRVEVGAGGGITPLADGIPVGRVMEAGSTGDLVELFLFQGASAAPAA